MLIAGTAFAFMPFRSFAEEPIRISENQFAKKLGHPIKAEVSAWKCPYPPQLHKIMGYQAFMEPFDTNLVQKWAKMFGVVGPVHPMPPGFDEAPGIWIKDATSSPGKTKTIYLSIRTGIMGYSSGDDGNRWDLKAHKPLVQNVPDAQAGLRRLASLLKELEIAPSRFGLDGDFQSCHYIQRLNTLRYVAKGSHDRSQVVMARTLIVSELTPFGYIMKRDGPGVASVTFISDGVVGNLEIGLLSFKDAMELRALDKSSIANKIENGLAYTFQDDPPSSVDIIECRIAYPLFWGGSSQIAWPIYELSCTNSTAAALFPIYVMP